MSEESAVGVGPAALDCRVAPGCPPGPVLSVAALLRDAAAGAKHPLCVIHQAGSVSLEARCAGAKSAAPGTENIQVNGADDAALTPGVAERGGGFCDGVSRRDFFHAGALSLLGLTLPGLLRAAVYFVVGCRNAGSGIIDI